MHHFWILRLIIQVLSLLIIIPLISPLILVFLSNPHFISITLILITITIIRFIFTFLLILIYVNFVYLALLIITLKHIIKIYFIIIHQFRIPFHFKSMILVNQLMISLRVYAMS